MRSIGSSNGPRQLNGGFTLLQVAVATVILTVVVSISVSTMSNAQDAVTQGQIRGVIHRRAGDALNRIVRLASQALTSDPAYLLLQPGSETDFHCLRFALLQSFDTETGTRTFSSDHVYVYGPHPGRYPNAGLVIGRGISLGAVWNRGKGKDKTLGTADDDTRTQTINGVAVVELLIPDRFAPRTGEMFSVVATPSPAGRLLTFTLRCNARDSDDQFVFENDILLVERVALRE